MLLSWFAIHLTSYVAASIYLLRKLGQAIDDTTSATSVQTVKLVKTARRNFIILVAVIIVMGVTPAFLVVGALAFMRNDQMQTVMTVVARYTTISFCSYSWIVTVTTILVTKPYRDRTLQLFLSTNFPNK
uniref:G_PROTEIN_RECEP_F1_2 domain-containing protein n=1 Tax=Steinernema glaseri TaxID=37863 RepID=A0A1I8A2P9_9BILA